MEINNYNDGTDHEDLDSFSDDVLSSDEETELDSSQEIFGAQLSKEESDARNYDIDDMSYRQAKRQRIMDERVISEKKRRKLIKDKVDELFNLMTPNPPKVVDFTSKLDNILVCISSLKLQRNMMARAYLDAGYMPPIPSDEAPWNTLYANPWGYYGQPLMMPQQIIPFIPQIPPANSHAQQSTSQGYATTQSDQSQV